MANIKVVLDHPFYDGMTITFNAPCECHEVNGVTVCFLDEAREFTFRDAHGNDLTGMGNLFAENVLVKAVLDVTNGYAYLQNADTNAYLEGCLSPTYTESTTLAPLTSGEKLKVAFSKIAKAVSSLIDHIANKSNPHEVTAAQVGARPDTWMPTAADVGARPNTWTPTASDVGAAPASHTQAASTITGLATVATSGSYNDLSNKPTIPTSLPANGGNADTVDSQHFTYSNSSNSPTYLWGTNASGTNFLAHRASMSVNYANSAGAVAWGNVSGKPSTFTPAAHNQAISTITGLGGYVTAEGKVQAGGPGTDMYWYYRKWSSGYHEVWCYVRVQNVACTALWGSIYESGELVFPTWPFTVSSVHFTTCEYNADTGLGNAWTEGLRGWNGTTPGATYLLRGSAGYSLSGKLMFYAIVT